MNIHGCECMVRLEAFIDAGRPVLKKKKTCFTACASTLNMGLIWYVVASGIWCLADVSSVSPSSEQTVLTKC